jgi:DNA-binding CsgD family transcriptional regulator
MRGERTRPPSGWESLTPTEVRVVEQVAAGLTNPQIAEALLMSRSTVKTHLVHVYAKLGIGNRAELAASAARRAEA